MSLGFEVRKARVDEVEVSRLLTNESWLATYSPLIGEDITSDIIKTRHSREVFANQQASNGHLFLIALEGNQVVGHCYAFPKDGWYVDRLHVLPTGKGQGIGRAMMQAVFDHVSPDTRIWLDVLKGNDAAMRFYERIGMKAAGETDACGGLAGIPAIYYETIVEDDK